jgi:hypothetical protein
MERRKSKREGREVSILHALATRGGEGDWNIFQHSKLFINIFKS